MIPLWLEQGGWSLWLLIILSLISVTIALFKLIEFTWFGVGNTKHFTDCKIRVSAQDSSTHNINMPHEKYLLSDIIYAALRYTTIHSKQNDYETAMEQYALNKLANMRTGLKLLEVTSVVAPLIGLLGTVLGMINAFDQLTNAGKQVDPNLLSAGISQALLTTAAGLIVAIPALSFWHLYEQQLIKSQRQIETILTEISLMTMWEEAKNETSN